MNGWKKCPKCGEIKELKYFNRKYGGYQPYCKDCNKKYCQSRKELLESRFEMIVLPNGIRCFQLKKEYRPEETYLCE